jgi:hypothetical protein
MGINAGNYRDRYRCKDDTDSTDLQDEDYNLLNNLRKFLFFAASGPAKTIHLRSNCHYRDSHGFQAVTIQAVAVFTSFRLPAPLNNQDACQSFFV